MRSLKKFFALLGVVAMVLSIWGCNGTKIQMENVFEFRDVVIETIANKDLERLQSYFIEDDLSSPNFERGVEYLFETLAGGICSVEDAGTTIGGMYSSRGKSIIPTVVCRIVTDVNTYMLYFEYYQEDKEFQNKIIRLRLFKEDELLETGTFNNHGGMGSTTGIYYPYKLNDG